MNLRSHTIRLGIFLSTLIIAAIVLFQLIWLKKVYYFEQKEFDHSIVKAVRGFYDDVDLEVNLSVHLSDLIKSPNYLTYIVKTDKPAHYDSLVIYMHNELEDENIFTDCYMGIYDADKGRYVYAAYLPAVAIAKTKAESLPFPAQKYHHIMLYFPHRRQYVLSRMNTWLISSALLLFVLILLGGSLYYFYKQKFLNEVQKDFVNNFTHEFKTPVSVINLAAEVLQNPDIQYKPERLLTYAGIVKYQGKYLQGQIERLLQYAFSEDKPLRLKNETVALQALTEEAVHNLRPLIEEKGASITYRFTAGHNTVKADRDYLLIVITNLVENALKYARQSRIEISTYSEQHYLVLSVKDNGKGIEKKHLKQIFKKFYRVSDGEQVSARGFGLGLPFVKRIVDAHHGKILVESNYGKGSNFIIKLPLL